MSREQHRDALLAHLRSAREALRKAEEQAEILGAPGMQDDLLSLHAEIQLLINSVMDRRPRRGQIVGQLDIYGTVKR